MIHDDMMIYDDTVKIVSNLVEIDEIVDCCRAESDK
jgi:hypothetical protein